MTNQETIMTFYAVVFLCIAFGVKLLVLYLLISLFTTKESKD